MSITINVAGTKAVLADGQWRSADATIQELLTDHLATLTLPGHYPPADRERQAAEAAVRDFGAQIIAYNPEPIDDPSREADGRIRIY